MPAATIFFFSEGVSERAPATLALVMLVVPALLMVSTIRFRSLKTINLARPVNSKVLVVVAAALALFAASPDIVLLLLAYGYLLSPAIEWLLMRGRRPAAAAAADALPDGAAAAHERDHLAGL